MSSLRGLLFFLFFLVLDGEDDEGDEDDEDDEDDGVTVTRYADILAWAEMTAE